MDSSDGFLHERSCWMEERRFVDVKWAGNKEKKDFLLPVFYVSWNLPCVADKYFVFLIAFLTLTLWGNFEMLVPQSNTFLKPTWRPVACLRMRERETEQTSRPLSLSFSVGVSHCPLKLHQCYLSEAPVPLDVWTNPLHVWRPSTLLCNQHTLSSQCLDVKAEERLSSTFMKWERRV